MSNTDDLFAAAARARSRAYAPYSRFLVGAAIRTADGEVHIGCNVENVAYPEGTCAEAGAIAAMVASGGSHEITAVLVLADSPEPISPCGGCRQKLAEFGGRDVPVFLAGPDAIAAETSIGALLPGQFSTEHLSTTD